MHWNIVQKTRMNLINKKIKKLLTLIRGGGGGGGIHPLDVLRDNFAEFFSRALRFRNFFFFFWVLHNF